MIQKKALSVLLFIMGVNGLPQATTLDATKLAGIATRSFAVLSCAPNATPDMEKLTRLLPKVLENAQSASNKSWEIGTLTQTLLEVYDPHFAPFEWDYSAVQNRQIPWNVLNITKAALADYDWSGSPDEKDTDVKKRSQPDSGEDSLTQYLLDNPPTPVKNESLVFGDGAQGDPCSVGPAVWMLAQLADRKEVKDSGGYRSPDDYAWAVGNQKYNLTLGPQDGNGTYSQRNDSFAVWADMGYMVPPFLAHLGLATNTSDFLAKALQQYEWEAGYILDTEHSLYRHVSQDWGQAFWATGNGWMTYGLMRVLASVYAAGKQEEFKSVIDTRLTAVGSVFDALLQQVNSESLLPNEMLERNTTKAQGESAGSALVLAAFYRYTVMAPNTITQTQRDAADKLFIGVVNKLGEDGWLTQVVDPSGKNGFDVDPTGRSPEGQSFLGMLWAARTAADHFQNMTQSIASGIEQAASATSSYSSSIETAASTSSAQ